MRLFKDCVSFQVYTILLSIIYAALCGLWGCKNRAHSHFLARICKWHTKTGLCFISYYYRFCLFLSFVFLAHVVFCLLVFGCQYQFNWLPGKTCLWNDLGVRVYPGSAETLVRRGVITNHHLIAYCLSNISAMNYQNWLMCVEVIVCNINVIVLRYSVVILMQMCSQVSDKSAKCWLMPICSDKT